MAKVAVIGTGYVGLSTGVCLAKLGHDVTCADIDKEKISALNQGKALILEDGLPELLDDGLAADRLHFVLGAINCVEDAEFIFLCLPTPQSETGEADLSYVVSAVEEISTALLPGAIVINKSTVPVGSTLLIESVLKRSDVFVVSNPEFLREGSAINDFMRPERIVIGSANQIAATRVSCLYSDLEAPVIITDAPSAEMIKYAANAFLATKLSFINSIATICEAVGADVNEVALGIGYDKRIGREFLRPGPGWGGSCFPKDTAALLHLAKSAGYEFEVLQSVVNENSRQFDRITDKIVMQDKPVRKVGVWGLTFKALTDDLRDSPSLQIIHRLLAKGITVSAYDPTVTDNKKNNFEIEITSSPVEAARGTDVVAVLTEWPDFQLISPIEVREVMRGNTIVDARNLLNKELWRDSGFDYIGIGRS